jgi:Glycosyltransferase like family 2
VTSLRQSVAVIIPTLGMDARAGTLQRAVRSVVDQDGVHGIPLVVLNGDRVSPDVERMLRGQARVRLLVRDEASLPGALHAGRGAIDTPFFGTLDDDDILLPGALARRLAALEQHPDASVVVTNGYVDAGAEWNLLVRKGTDVDGDPLRALLRRNWLLPGSWLARTDVVDEQIFAGMPKYAESTYLAMMFATRYRMRWLQAPSVVYHIGSPMAESQQPAYIRGQVDALRRLLALPLPDDVVEALRVRVTQAHHHIAEMELEGGALREAWRQHLASLRSPQGWRHALYTRHLLRGSLGRFFSARGDAPAGPTTPEAPDEWSAADASAGSGEPLVGQSQRD